MVICSNAKREARSNRKELNQGLRGKEKSRRTWFKRARKVRGEEGYLPKNGNGKADDAPRWTKEGGICDALVLVFSSHSASATGLCSLDGECV